MKPTALGNASGALRPLETGLPIHRRTLCEVGAHMTITYGREPRQGDHCDCGLIEWQWPKILADPKETP